jgi:outer membrane protein assembly factor BamB
MGYNPEDGTEIWKAKCLAGEIAPSPIFAGGMVIAIEPYVLVAAIRPSGKGDVTKSHVAWKSEVPAPDICSPLCDGKFVYTMMTDGLFTCIDLKNGEKVWEHSFSDAFNASPSLVDDRIYLLSEKGRMDIIKAGPRYQEITQSRIEENCYASPAFVYGRIYIRGQQNLYCIGRDDSQKK